MDENKIRNQNAVLYALNKLSLSYQTANIILNRAVDLMEPREKQKEKS